VLRIGRRLWACLKRRRCLPPLDAQLCRRLAP